MKITATVGSTVTTLGDDSAGNRIVELPMPAQRRQAQVEPLALAAAVFSAGRGNAETSFSWSVLWVLADLATACAFVWTHAATVPVTSALTILDDSGGTTTYSTAQITEVTITEINGVNVRVRYSVQGATA